METNTASTVTATRADQGGPAFPTDIYYDERLIHQQWGMSLRDYIAIHAPGEEVSAFRYNEHGAADKGWTEARYKYADAMLKARNA